MINKTGEYLIDEHNKEVAYQVGFNLIYQDDILPEGQLLYEY
jgi:hypothetical protein